MSNPNALEHKAMQLSRIIRENVSTEELIKFTKNINAITICVKLRSFQYRLILPALITNIQLKIYGIKENDLCSFRGVNRETIVHILFECPKVKVIWKQCER